MNSFYQPIAITSYILGIAGVASVALAVVRANTIKNTVSVLKENNQALQERVTILENALKSYTQKHEANLHKILELETQITYLKTIPLEKISKHMEASNKSLDSIVKVLQDVDKRLK